MILFQTFDLLDVFGPLDALQMLSKQQQLDLFLLSESLDPITTEPTASFMNPKNSSFFPKVLPTHTFADAPDLDVLIVPGGLGTRSPFLNGTIDYIRNTYPKLKYLLTVCTGAGVAARAGVLDGKRATTNKLSWNSTVSLRTEVNWVPKARWIVDGNTWSSSGISAGIDLTLAFVEHIHGNEVANTVANQMEYEWHNDSSWDPFSAIFNVPLLNV